MLLKVRTDFGTTAAAAGMAVAIIPVTAETQRPSFKRSGPPQLP